jgi:hypothetical protein
VARLAASMSIGTGFTGVGAVWAKRGGKQFGWGRCQMGGAEVGVVGFGWGRCQMGGAEVGAVGFGWGAAKCADRKAALAAWFWSN